MREKNPNFNLEEGYDSRDDYLTPGNPDDNNNNFNFNGDDNQEENNINNDNNNEKVEISLNLTKINIIFTYNEENTILECDNEITVEQLINMYNKKSGNNIIENNIFKYNGKVLDITDKRKIKEVFSNNSIILVQKK